MKIEKRRTVKIKQKKTKTNERINYWINRFHESNYFSLSASASKLAPLSPILFPLKIKTTIKEQKQKKEMIETKMKKKKETKRKSKKKQINSINK